MDSLRFAPELFEHRARAMAVLEPRGFSWLGDYSPVDCLHDLCGIEGGGIKERADAVRILRILMRLFPTGKPG
jgi:hypothetical protein